MNLRATEGDKVILRTLDVGYESHKELVKKYLVLNSIYTVDWVAVDSWSSEVYLKEVPGIAFNTVFFKDVNELSPWILIESKMPKTLQTVYVVVEVEIQTKPEVKTSQFQTMAKYVPYLTVPENDFIAEEYQGDGDYDEEKDEYFAPEGWYEYQLESDIHFKLSEKVTHWMPLFELPKKL